MGRPTLSTPFIDHIYSLSDEFEKVQKYYGPSDT
jgi:hypothetical protein